MIGPVKAKTNTFWKKVFQTSFPIYISNYFKQLK